MLDAITFGLAYAAYVLLCSRTLLGIAGVSGAMPRVVTFALAGAALAHVALVWHYRLEWSLTEAWERNPAAFLIFHSALVLIVAAALAGPRWSTWLVWVAFPIVSAGALGAVFRRAVVAQYRGPVIAALGVSVIAGVWIFWTAPPGDNKAIP